jgi:cation transport ATPase
VTANDNETEAERLDRELVELVQELRVLLPGVQVLLAFLLTVPFSVGFRDVTGPERALYFAALAATTVSAVLLIAPSARHRARFRDRDKEALVVSSNRLALLSTAFLAAAMIAVVILVGAYLYDWVVGVVGGVATLALIAWFWYGWSMSRRANRGE